MTPAKGLCTAPTKAVPPAGRRDKLTTPGWQSAMAGGQAMEFKQVFGPEVPKDQKG
eukprot:CAMPEP_0174334532 /NCGR_PEP_ID=MMETSP0810-20121108/20003_1 /TAXON_ID=73025 ORGANISM="Eutreptiella gymnastica-like, Strain CCMP1594" /NCGR_SAMPLE_ID=MMETSP0810 /ASSEMBLY_ACC=CAM_ASM_000659 /LENGTH=55 /DNA_ID=CAMNT_0015452257 /DNA_START=309 /DNA_END=474 /DNA_ORIENTATION=+